MKIRFNYKNITIAFIAVLMTMSMQSCKYDLRELEPKPLASFTVTPVTGQVNRYLLTSTSTNTFRYDWDKGSGYAQGNKIDTVYFPDKGDYTVKLWAYGHNGMD
ncbi:MAG: hypothetical protein WCF67_02725, partial [Chitinophagaceae bacterium]